MERILRPIFVAPIVLLSFVTGGNSPPRETGVIGGTVELVFRQNFPDPVKEVVWKHNNGSKTSKLVAKFKDNKLETGHPQFENHLEILRDGNGLRITDLTFNHNGTYTAKITLDNHTVYEESFIVSLYEPVPAPSIRTDYENGTSDGCMVIVHCDVPANATSVSYTWKYRYNGSDYKLYNSTANTIQIFLQLEYPEVMCIVQNPADSKNVSVTLTPCQQKESHQNRHHWFIFAAILLVVSAAYIVYCKTKELKHGVQETFNHISLQNKCKNSEEEKPFPVSENTVKYQYFILVHKEKEDDKMAFGDDEFPYKVPPQEVSEKTSEF